MFTYLNPTVRQRLIADGKLIRINEHGETITTEQPPAEGGLAVNVLGPIPLPIRLGDLEIATRWYATVRSTELAKVE